MKDEARKLSNCYDEDDVNGELLMKAKKKPIVDCLGSTKGTLSQ